MDQALIIAAIDDEIGKLRQARELLSGSEDGTSVGEKVTTGKGTRRRKISPAARNRMAEAQRKRWSAVKAAKKVGKPKTAKKASKKAPAKKAAATKSLHGRTMSLAAKKRIAEAQRKRRAAVKSAKTTSAKTAANRAPAKKAAAAKKSPAKVLAKAVRKVAVKKTVANKAPVVLNKAAPAVATEAVPF